MRYGNRRLSALLLGSLLAAQALPAAAGPPDTLDLSLAAPMQTLDIHRNSAVMPGALLKLVYETLTQAQADGTITGVLATGWSVSEDKLSWTIKLREGIRFQDGTPFDAAAVHANFERLLNKDKPVPGRSNLGPISRTEVVDEHTIRIVTSTPFSGLLIALSHPVSGIVSPKAIADGTLDGGTRAAAGTGPYAIAEFKLPDRVVLKAQPGYWGAKPGMREIAINSRSDDQSRMAGLLAGESDAVFYLTSEGRRRVAADDRFEVSTIPSIREFIVHLPFGVKAYQDIRVRKALNLAIDREQIIKTVFQGEARIADAAIGPGVFGYRAEAPYGYDPKKAAELLAEAGWRKGPDGILTGPDGPFPTLTMMATRGRQPNDARLAQALAGYLKAIGVPVTLQIEEFGTFFAAAREQAKTGDKLVQMAWGFPQMDGTYFLCSVYRPGDSYNFGRYANKAVQEGCDRINQTFDATERAKVIADAAKAVYDDAAAIFVVVPSYIVGARKGLKGVVLDAGENHQFAGAKWQ